MEVIAKKLKQKVKSCIFRGKNYNKCYPLLRCGQNCGNATRWKINMNTNTSGWFNRDHKYRALTSWTAKVVQWLYWERLTDADTSVCVTQHTIWQGKAETDWSWNGPWLDWCKKRDVVRWFKISRRNKLLSHDIIINTKVVQREVRMQRTWERRTLSEFFQKRCVQCFKMKQ